MWLLVFLVSMSMSIVIIIIIVVINLLLLIMLLLGCGEDGRAADDMGLPKSYTAVGHSLRRAFLQPTVNTQNPKPRPPYAGYMYGFIISKANLHQGPPKMNTPYWCSNVHLELSKSDCSKCRLEHQYGVGTITNGTLQIESFIFNTEVLFMIFGLYDF